LLMKLVVHAADRASAIARMRRALHETRIGGLTTNVPLLLDVLDDPRFASGAYDTTMLEGWTGPRANGHGDDAAAAVAAALALHHREARVPIEDERTREARRMTGGSRKARGGGDVRSVMPGVVKEVRVKAGDAVEAKSPLLVLEAMKMENEIRADRAGVVKA